MLKHDPYFEVKDIDSPNPPGLGNALQMGVDLLAASETSPAARFPAAPPTWGAGRVLVFGTDVASFDDGDTIVLDDSMDWRNRFVILLALRFFDAAKKVPGGGSEPANQLTASRRLDLVLSLYTGAGITMDDDPPSGGPFLPIANWSDLNWAYLFCDASHRLALRNDSGAEAYVWAVVFVTDQFPTRLP
jgi:hypothetical protein